MIIFKVKHDIPKCHFAFFLPEMKPSEIQVNGLGRPLLLPLKTFSFTSKYVREASFFFSFKTSGCYRSFRSVEFLKRASEKRR